MSDPQHILPAVSSQHTPVLSFALIGYGHAGKKHADAIARHPSCKLVAVVEKDAGQTASIPAGIPVFTELEALLSRGPAFDVLCVATPNGCHETQAIEALRAGRHVLVEKPLALTEHGAARMIEEARKSGRRLWCVLQNRFSAGARWLKGLQEEGRLGRVTLIHVSALWNRNEAYYRDRPWRGSREVGGSIAFTQFAHLWDLLLWVFGDIDKAEGFSSQTLLAGVSELPDTGVCQFRFTSGAIGTFDYTVAVPGKNFETVITIVTSEGVIKLAGQYLDQLIHTDIPGTREQFEALLLDEKRSDHYWVMEDLLLDLQGRHADSTAMDSWKVVRLLEQLNDWP